MKWFNDLKVAVKVLLSCSVFMIIIIGISGNTYFSVNSADKEFKDFFSNRFITSLELNKIQKDLLQLRINMLVQLDAAKEGNLIGVQKIVDENRLITDDYRKNLDSYMTSVMTEAEKKLTDEFTDKSKSAAEIRPKIAEAFLKGNIAEGEKYMNAWVVGYRDTIAVIDKLVDLKIEDGKKIQEKQSRDVTATNILLLVMLMTSLVIGIVITTILSKSVSGPVKKGLAFAELIAQGNFLERIDLDQKDELGQLGKALNTSADNLEKLISEIIMASQNLVRAVEEIASGNENLSQRTSEQASSLEEIAATVEETNASTRQNAGNANEANTLADTSSKLAVEGGQIVENAVLSIGEINKSSKKISEIINMINEIAFQTNLLALNAAVEAARAGDQGRGFAVVAGEVRNLAQRSAGAAKEIGSLIKDSISKIDEGTDLVNKSGNALKEIILSAKQVKDIIAEIAASSDEQSRGIEQINTAVTEMDTMTQQNAALVEETAAASEEMSNQAQELLSMVQEFKIRESLTSGTQVVKRKEVHIKSLQTKESVKNPAKIESVSAKKYNPEHDGYEKF
jgi:methyl-accepting chemotaxis protein